MKRILVAIGILVLIGLVLLTQQIGDDTPTPSFSMSQGPSDSLIKPLAVVCTPDAGYDFCYTNTYGAATATIHSTNWQGEQRYVYVDGAKRWVYIDEVYVNVKYRGDALYKSSSTSWMSCSSSGCSATSIPAGKVVIASAPATSIPPIQFAAWDKFTSTSGAWWHSYVQFGWLSSTPYYVIDCYDNNDCDSGNYCDKSGDWDTWSCKIDPCNTMPEPRNICDGFDLWSQKCVMGEYVKDELIQPNSIKCGCKITKSPPNTCVGYDLWSQKQEKICVDGVILDKIIESNSKECDYLCTEGETISFTCTDGTEINTQECVNNVWVDVQVESCPLNWINLESILYGYIEDIKQFIGELL